MERITSGLLARLDVEFRKIPLIRRYLNAAQIQEEMFMITLGHLAAVRVKTTDPLSITVNSEALGKGSIANRDSGSIIS